MSTLISIPLLVSTRRRGLQKALVSTERKGSADGAKPLPHSKSLPSALRENRELLPGTPTEEAGVGGGLGGQFCPVGCVYRDDHFIHQCLMKVAGERN